MSVAPRGKTNPVLVRAFAEALTLVEENAVDDGASLLSSHFSTSDNWVDMDASLGRRALAIARDLAEQAHPSAAAQFYEVCVNSGVPVSLEDILVLWELNCKLLARRAVVGSEIRGVQRAVSVVYVMQDSEHLGPMLSRWYSRLESESSDRSIVDDYEFRLAVAVGITLRELLVSDSPAFLSSIADDEIGMVVERYRWAIVRGEGVEEMFIELSNLHAGAITALLRAVLNEAREWLRSTGILLELGFRSQLDREDAADCPIEGGEAIGDDDVYISTMVRSVLLGADRDRLSEALRSILNRRIEPFENAISLRTRNSGLIGSLETLVVTVVDCFMDRLAVPLKHLDERLRNTVVNHGHLSRLTIAVQLGYILRLLRSGRVRRAQSEFAILKESSAHCNFDTKQFSEFLAEVMHVYAQSRQWRTDALLRGSIGAGTNLFSMLRGDLRTRSLDDRNNMAARFMPAATVLRDLTALEHEKNMASFVKVAGEKCDELISAGYENNELTFGIRLKQGLVLELLGRLGHSKRVLEYVLSRAEKLDLTLAIQSRSTAILARVNCALGSVEEASRLFDKVASKRPLTPIELYIHSFVAERQGRYDVACSDLEQFQASHVSVVDLEILQIGKSAATGRLRLLRQTLSNYVTSSKENSYP